MQYPHYYVQMMVCSGIVQSFYKQEIKSILTGIERNICWLVYTLINNKHRIACTLNGAELYQLFASDEATAATGGGGWHVSPLYPPSSGKINKNKYKAKKESKWKEESDKDEKGRSLDHLSHLPQ